MLATARILMPSMVRLAAGRDQLTREAVVLCFMAARTRFSSAKLLTTPNPA
jgi:biotin synthase